MSALIRRHRNFRLLWTGETSSQAGTSVTTTVLPLAAVSVLHASAFTVSLLTAAAWLPWVLIGLPAGAWIDSVRRRRRLMIGCDLVSAALFATVPLARLLGHLTDIQLLLVALGAGCSSVVFSTTYKAFVIDIVSDATDRAAANSALQGSASAAQIGGPGLGGLLAQAVGAATALLADCASFLVSASCLAVIRARPRPVAAHGGAQPIRKRIRAGIHYLRHDPLQRPLVLFGGVANLAMTGYQSILIVFLVREVGLRAVTVGIVLALTSCGGVLGALIANPVARRIGSGHALLAAKGGGCAAALLIPLTTSSSRLGFLVTGGFLVGVGIVAGNIISTTFVQSYTPPAIYARISATTNVINFGTMPLGAVLGGALASAFGLPAALWVTTVMTALSALILLASPLRRLRDLPAGQPGAERPERPLVSCPAGPQRQRGSLPG